MTKEPEIRKCVDDGWEIHKWTMAISGRDSIKSLAQKSFKPMCLDCRAFIDGHIALGLNTGSDQPPAPGANARSKRRKIGRKDKYAR